MIALLCAVAALLWFAYRSIRNRHIAGLSRKLRSDLCCLPFIGHSYIFIGNDEQLMKGFQRLGTQAIKYGGLTKLWHANYLFMVVADPEAVEILSRTCLSKPDIVKTLQLLIGNGSLFAPVSVWRPRRKILAPIFSMKTLNSFVPIFAKQSGIMANRLQEVADKGTFSIWKYLNSFSMNAVCETTLGIQVNSQNSLNQDFLKAFDTLSEMAAEKILQPWLDIELFFKMSTKYSVYIKYKRIIINFVSKIIETKRRELLDKMKSKEDLTLLEQLILSESVLSETELLEEILVMILAGTDTSAVGTSFTCLMMSIYQDVQAKVYDELQNVFGDSNRPVELSDLPKLKYLEAVIKETLRLYPSVPAIAREAEKDIVLNSGLKVPSGCGIIFHIWAIHRNPTHWGADAEEFIPERFLGDISKLHRAAFIPFSYGPRGCLGYQYAMMTMKTAMATLLRQYRFLPAEGAQQLPLRLKYDIMMRHVDNYKMQVQSRNIIN